MSPALQPMDGYVNPMARMGTVPPTQYSPGNMLGGNLMTQFVNPEAMCGCKTSNHALSGARIAGQIIPSPLTYTRASERGRSGRAFHG